MSPSTAPQPPNSRTKLWKFIERLGQSAWFAYGTIFLLQLHVCWAMWRFRDLTPGDTSSYFINASHWFYHGVTPILWSPLYTSFYGSLLAISPDAFTVTILHRYLIIFAASFVILALMRRLFPPDAAWVATAWWVLQPIDFNTLYEVHLFAVIPVVLAALLISKSPSHWNRGAAVATMLVATLLVRNELLLATGLLAAAFLFAGLWGLRRGQATRVNSRILAAYLVPLTAAGLLTLFYYRHAEDASMLGPSMERKHTLNICQTYAFGYQQRYTDFQKSPWTECRELMTRVYGTPEPSLVEALRRNPRAMAEHFLWNVRLIPFGLQVLLLNVSSGTTTPDYVPVTNSRFAWAGSAILLLIVVTGSLRLRREWRYWWESWLKSRVWSWVLLAAVAVVTCGVMVTQRPRPSYMLSMGVLLRAIVAMLFLVLIAKTPWRKRCTLAYPIVAVLAILSVPAYYPLMNPSGQQPLRVAYERLEKFHAALERPGTNILISSYGWDLCNYVTGGICVAADYANLRSEVSANNDWLKVLTSHSINAVYVDEAVAADPSGKQLVAELSPEWRRLGTGMGAAGEWILFARPGR